MTPTRFVVWCIIFLILGFWLCWIAHEAGVLR
jgi:hypothetical protein